MYPRLAVFRWRLLFILGFAVILSGCVGVVVDVARDVTDAAFDVTESVAEIPIDVADGMIHIPDNMKGYHSDEIQWAFPVDRITLIDAETSNGSIKITLTDGPEIKVHAKKEVWARAQSKADMYANQIVVKGEIQGDKLRVYKDHPVLPNEVRVCVSYEIQAPQNMSLRLETSNGWMNIDSIHGTIHARTTNGKIEMSKCNGVLEASSTNGPLTLQDCTGPATLKTTNGGIHFSNLSGQVKAETSNSHIQGEFAAISGYSEFVTSNGGIDIKIRQGNEPVYARTSNGSINLFLPSAFAGQLDAKTSSASIRTHIPVTATQFSERHLTGTIGGGGDTKIDLSSTNGGITIDRY